MKRRILAILLAAIMVLSSVPFSVFATEGEAVEAPVCPGDPEKAHLKADGSYYTTEEAAQIGTYFNTVPATCGQIGYDVYDCSTCKGQFIANVKPAVDSEHNFGDLVEAKAATCTETGNVEYYHCSKCGGNYATDKVTLLATVVIDALDHNWSAWAMDEADCSKEVRYCLRDCGVANETRPAANNQHNHKYELKELTEEAPTCAQSSKATIVCTECGHEVKDVPVASDVPHVFGDVVEAVPNTCTTAGNVAYKTCTVCNKNFHPTAEYEIADVVLPALGHGVGRVLNSTPGDCLRPGVRTYICYRCDEIVENEEFDERARYMTYGYYVKKGDSVDTSVVVIGANLRVDGTWISGYYVCVANEDGELFSTSALYSQRDKYFHALKDGESLVRATDENGDYIYVHSNLSVISQAATCNTWEIEKLVCRYCASHVDMKLNPPLGHEKGDFLAGESIAPTCEANGLNAYKCVRCYVRIYEIAPKLGHKWEEVSTATCVNPGVKYTICKNGTACDGKDVMVVGVSGHTVVVNGPDNKQYTAMIEADTALVLDSWKFADVDPDAHDWELGYILNAPTCTDKGIYYDYCKNCGKNEKREESALGHNFVLTWTGDVEHTLANADQYVAANIVAAKCEEDGYLKIKCTDCDVYSDATHFANRGNTVSLKINKLGHDDEKTVVEPTCTTGGYSFNTCQRTGCGRVSEKFDETDPHELQLSYPTFEAADKYHNINLADGVVKVEGSCKIIGLTQYKCADCGKNVMVEIIGTGSHKAPAEANRITDKNDPDFNFKPYKPATCYAPGNLENFKCTVCGEWNLIDDVIEQDTHEYELVFDAMPGYCTPTGLFRGHKALYTCKANDNCYKNHFFVIVDDEYVEIDVTGYTVYTDAEKTTVVANHTGVKLHPMVVTARGAHDLKDKSGKAATCTEPGYTAYKACELCGYETGKATIPALHDVPANWETVSKDVNCEQEKYVLTYCKFCADPAINGAAITGYAPELGHNWVKGEVVAPTCKAPGYTPWTCGNVDCPENGYKETDATAQLDHKKGDVAIGNTADGYKNFVCGVYNGEVKCDNYDDCGFVVTSHVEQKTLVPPTCTEDGYYVYTCADENCKQVIKEATVIKDSKYNHFYDDGTSAWREYARDPATETATGTIYLRCERCQAEDTKVIPPVATVYLDLTYANANDKEGFAESSIVEVEVLLSSKLAAINTLSFALDYDETKLEFLGATADVAGIFSVESINNANGVLKFAGMSSAPIEVGEAVVVATVTFRAINAGVAHFEFVDDTTPNDNVDDDLTAAYIAYEDDNGDDQVAEVKVDTSIDDVETVGVFECDITIVELMDVNKDGKKDMQDALAIYALMNRTKYDVAADLDKDGVVGSNDLTLFYDFFVEAKTEQDIFDYVVN